MRFPHARLSTSILVALALANVSVPAMAQHLDARHDAPVFRGEIGRFHEHDWAVWHSGHWEHVEHGGRVGWWWIAGGVWYFYPYPVYPYPDPYVPPVVSAAPPPAEVLPPPPTPSAWYFCPSSKGYYPYVPSCPEGWKAVPATPVVAGSEPTH
jgi:hypothetical protein